MMPLRDKIEGFSLLRSGFACSRSPLAVCGLCLSIEFHEARVPLVLSVGEEDCFSQRRRDNIFLAASYGCVAKLWPKTFSRVFMWNFLESFFQREVDCPSCAFLHSGAYNTDVMARALAAFLYHEDLGWGKTLPETQKL